MGEEESKDQADGVDAGAVKLMAWIEQRSTSFRAMLGNKRPTAGDVKIAFYAMLLASFVGVADTIRAAFSIPAELLGYLGWALQQRSKRLEREDEILAREKALKEKQEAVDAKNVEVDKKLREAVNLTEDVKKTSAEWNEAIKVNPVVMVLKEEAKREAENRHKTNQAMLDSLGVMVSKFERIEAGFKRLSIDFANMKVGERLERLEERKVYEDIVTSIREKIDKETIEKHSVAPSPSVNNEEVVKPTDESTAMPPTQGHGSQESVENTQSRHVEPHVEPHLEEEEDFDKIKAELDEKCVMILDEIRKTSEENMGKPTTAADVAEKLGIGLRTVYDHCSHLKEFKLIEPKQNAGITVTEKGHAVLAKIPAPS